MTRRNAVKKLRTKKGLAILLAGAIVLGGAGAALAYFTSTGNGTGNATVGTAGSWTVATSAPTGGLLYPGTGTDTVAYTVTNSGSGYQELNGTTAALTTDVAGGVFDTTTHAFVDGCQASWFTVTNTTVSGDVAPSADLSSSLTITMQDSGTVQDPCKNLTPQVTISAS
jgi:hypothetical protein